MNDSRTVPPAATTPITQFHSRCCSRVGGVAVRTGEEDAREVQRDDDHHHVRGDAVRRAQPPAERHDVLDVLDRLVRVARGRDVEDHQRQAGDEQRARRGPTRRCRARATASRRATSTRIRAGNACSSRLATIASVASPRRGGEDAPEPPARHQAVLMAASARSARRPRPSGPRPAARRRARGYRR